ncbi:MAG: hypothetical protein ABSG54_18705 [Terriglobia bacterium]
MRNVLRAAFGVRRDPDLENRSWHRFSKVFLVVSSVVVFLTGILVSFGDPDRRLENVRVIDTLRSYTQSHPELANSVPSFRDLGHVGVLTDSGRIGFHYLSEDDVMCSSNLDVHPKEVAQFLRRGDPKTYGDMDTKAAVAWLEQQREAGGSGRCITRESVELPSSNKIVAWTFTPAARAASYARAGGIGALVFLCYALVALNLYYRGLIYIILGARGR